MTVNPWFEEAANPEVADAATPADRADELTPTPQATGPTEPQPGQVTSPHTSLADLELGAFIPRTKDLWVVGVHGGAGETTVGHLLDATPTGRSWPEGSPSADVLLVARTHGSGLQRLQAVATAWAAGALPTANLLGAVLVPDAPGRLPTPLAQVARLTAGGLPHHWHLDWHDELRFGPALTMPSFSSRRLKRVRREITALHHHN